MAFLPEGQADRSQARSAWNNRVPEGHMTVARRLIAGSGTTWACVPGGRPNTGARPPRRHNRRRLNDGVFSFSNRPRRRRPRGRLGIELVSP
jgi:hypothetical protein